MNLPDEKREAVAEVLSWASGEMTRYSETAHPDHNRWSWRGDGHGEARREAFRAQADTLAPLLARWLAEARGEDRVVSVRHESDCDWVTNNSWCSCGLDDAFEAGLAEGEARVRARVEAILSGWGPSVAKADVRAALDTDAAETTGGDA